MYVNETRLEAPNMGKIAKIGLFPDTTSTSSLENQFDMLTKTQNTIVQCERVFFALLFLALFCGNILVIYRYLYKQRMYKSFLLVITYIALSLLSLTEIVYQLFSGFVCRAEDCEAMI